MHMIPVDELRLHPAINLVPEMRPEEFEDLRADIIENGIKEPLATDGRIVLDGRHRLRAAKEIGIKKVPIRVVEMGSDDPATYMLKSAVLRRHLTDDQRAMIAAKYAVEHKQKPSRKEGAAQQTLAEHKASADRHPTRTRAARILNVKPSRVAKAQGLLVKNATLAEQVRTGDIQLKAAIRNVKRAEQARDIAAYKPPEGTFNVIAIDPPWHFDKHANDVTHLDGADYPRMSLDEICALPVAARAAEDCLLFLWAPNAIAACGDHAKVLAAWGFSPKTILCWDKTRIGLGDWLRNQTELCIVAARGKPIVTLTNQSTLLAEARREGSRKPDAFYKRVESLCPATARLDWFARETREGWTCCGAEMGAFKKETKT